MKLLWGILPLLFTAPEVTSECPSLPNTNGVMTANISWTVDMWYTGCTASVAGETTLTSFSKGEVKSLPGVGNDCIKFRCDQSLFLLDQDASSCAYGSECTRTAKLGGECGEQYTCTTKVYEEIAEYGTSEWYRYRHGWFKFYSGYSCGSVGSGPCTSVQCYNPASDPKKSDAETTRCLGVDETWTSPDNKVYTCMERSTCGSDTYPDIALNRSGCQVNGSFVVAGTVTWSDACSHTVCVVDDEGTGQLVTSFKDGEGCVYEDQCVAVGSTVQGHVGYVCANLTCQKDTSRSSPFYFQETQTGCYHEGRCYADRKSFKENGQCDVMKCKSTDVTYSWDVKYTGCYQPGETTCTHKNGELFWQGDCLRLKCNAKNSATWSTTYKTSGKCVPRADSCLIDGIPGCFHKRECHPVKTVLAWDACTQYVCHSDDPDLNNGVFNEGTALPTWQARATGCYGPWGCMKLGQQIVDSNTLNTYRCDYALAGWGAKIADIHEACVAPNGQKLALGESVKLGPVWYSCYRNGKIKNPIDTSIEFVPEDSNHTCGLNPDTGETLWKAEYYYTPVGRCIKRGYNCEETCQYYDQPCLDTDITPWRWLGQEFTLSEGGGESQCVCTQDNSINNNGLSGRFYKPSLCSQQGVTGGACKDSTDNSVHQWGEMWEKAGSNPTEVCACHPLTRQPFCSSFLPDVCAIFNDMKI